MHIHEPTRTSKHALIVLSHPDPTSLTHAVGRAFAEGVQERGLHTAEIADIHAEGFQAAYNQADRCAYGLNADLPPDVRREQERVDRADALALVYPVYWWSFPGLLKGWIDRVFSNGWAYSESADGQVEKRLGRLAIHLIGIGGAGGGTYERHGYHEAMRTQIDHGIFGYCGAPVLTSKLLLDVNGKAAASHVVTARALGAAAFSRTNPAPANNAQFAPVST